MYFSGSVTQRIQVCNRMLTPTSCYRPVDILPCNSEIQKLCFEMEAQSSSVDIGLVSPEWLQSDDSFSFEAFGDIDELMANLPDFAATPPRPSDVGATPSHPLTTYANNRAQVEDAGLALVPRLKYEHVHLTSYSKMRVDLAAQVSNIK